MSDLRQPDCGEVPAPGPVPPQGGPQPQHPAVGHHLPGGHLQDPEEVPLCPAISHKAPQQATSLICPILSCSLWTMVVSLFACIVDFYSSTLGLAAMQFTIDSINTDI